MLDVGPAMHPHLANAGKALAAMVEAKVSKLLGGRWVIILVGTRSSRVPTLVASCLARPYPHWVLAVPRRPPPAPCAGG